VSNIDWEPIKHEYIYTKTSYRKLAEKHGISFNTLKDAAVKNGWAKLKKREQHKITTKAQQKTVEKIVTQEVDRVSKILELTDKLTPKIEKAISQLEKTIVEGKTISSLVDTYRMRQITQTLKDLKDLAKEDNTNDMAKLDEVLSKIEGNI
jgi:citrate lyase synthetase